MQIFRDAVSDDAGCDHRGDEAEDDRQIEAAQVTLRGRGGQHGAGVGPDCEEAGNAGVEHAGEAPLHVEAERHNRVDAAKGQERDDVKADAVELVHG